jgi:nucleoside-diphosphate-sugar epimerase
MQVLVTGGAGMIGSHLVDALLVQGDQVIVLDNFLTGRPSNLAHLAAHSRLQIVEADVAAAADLLHRVGRIDRIYHLASPASPIDFARYPQETLVTNAEGTHVVLELARDIGARFLLASTSEVYGDPAEHPQTETYWGHVNPTGPRSCYDEGKRYAESLTMTFWRSHGVDARIVRLFNTYGPRNRLDDGRVVPAFCVQALTGQPLTVYGNGEQTRSLCYVEDIVRGLLVTMETAGLGGEVFNLGSPEERTVLQIAKLILALADRPHQIDHQPLPVDDPTRRCPDIGKARRLLGWAPRVTLEDGLSRSLEAVRCELEAVGGTDRHRRWARPPSIAVAD